MKKSDLGRPIHIQGYLTTPEKARIKNFQSIANYFMYYAPNIECKHNGGEKILDDQAQEVIRAMQKNAGMNEKQFQFYKTKSSHAMANLNLVGDEICLVPNRLACKKLKKEDELTALLRHIRNSFAHGLIYVQRKKGANLIMLEDHEAQKPEISARIIVTDKVLSDWKAILENEIAVGE